MRTRSRAGGRLLGFVTRSTEQCGLPILLVLLVLFFAVYPDSRRAFNTSANLNNILAGQSVTGIIALGMVIPLAAGYFDVSIAAVAGLTNVAAAALIVKHGQSIWVGMLAALLVGAFVGAINGVLVAYFKLNGLIITLGVYTVVGGLIQWYTHGASSSGVPDSLGNWGSLKWLGIPRPFWLLIVVGLVLWYLLMHTAFGREFEAVGSNEAAARLVGIRVERRVFSSFVLAGLIAGVAGILLTSRSGGADPSAGPSYLFPALAAVFLGATTIRPGKYNVWGTILGIFFVAVGVTGFTLIGADAWVTSVFDGGVLIIAVFISSVVGRRRAGFALAVVAGPPEAAAVGETSPATAAA